MRQEEHAAGSVRAALAGPRAMTGLAAVARTVGVSTSTASRALTRPEMVRPEVVERVRAAALALGYSPNPFARSLRVRDSKTLGLIVPDNTNPFFAEVAKGIEAACFRVEYSLILCNSDRSLDKERAQAGVLHDKRVDGVLLFTVNDQSAETIRWLQRQGLPVVVVERRSSGVAVDCVVSDNAGGIRLAVEHLYSQGHRTIGFLDGDLAASHYAERMLAFERLLDEHGLPVTGDLVRTGLVSYADGASAALDLLSGRRAPTALLCATDTLAVGAIRGAALSHKRVPEDVAIVGFGDTEPAAYAHPPLTSVTQDKLTVGARAVRLLLVRVSQHGKGSSTPRRPKTEVVATTLSVRESSNRPLLTRSSTTAGRRARKR